MTIDFFAKEYEAGRHNVNDSNAWWLSINASYMSLGNCSYYS